VRDAAAPQRRRSPSSIHRGTRLPKRRTRRREHAARLARRLESQPSSSSSSAAEEEEGGATEPAEAMRDGVVVGSVGEVRARGGEDGTAWSRADGEAPESVPARFVRGLLGLDVPTNVLRSRRARWSMASGRGRRREADDREEEEEEEEAVTRAPRARFPLSPSMAAMSSKVTLARCGNKIDGPCMYQSRFVQHSARESDAVRNCATMDKTSRSPRGSARGPWEAGEEPSVAGDADPNSPQVGCAVPWEVGEPSAGDADMNSPQVGCAAPWDGRGSAALVREIGVERGRRSESGDDGFRARRRNTRGASAPESQSCGRSITVVSETEAVSGLRWVSDENSEARRNIVQTGRRETALSAGKAFHPSPLPATGRLFSMRGARQHRGRHVLGTDEGPRRGRGPELPS
jgi:hypothetical protein